MKPSLGLFFLGGGGVGGGFEAKFKGFNLCDLMESLWPLPRETCQEYAQEMVKLAFKLMELVALSLGLPADRFHGFFKDQTSFVRFNRYPTCPNPHLALGVGRHKDSGAVTILGEDGVPGLEVKRRKNGEWVRVKHIPDAYIINIGDNIKVSSLCEREEVYS